MFLAEEFNIQVSSRLARGQLTAGQKRHVTLMNGIVGSARNQRTNNRSQRGRPISQLQQGFQKRVPVIRPGSGIPFEYQNGSQPLDGVAGAQEKVVFSALDVTFDQVQSLQVVLFGVVIKTVNRDWNGLVCAILGNVILERTVAGVDRLPRNTLHDLDFQRGILLSECKVVECNRCQGVMPVMFNMFLGLGGRGRDRFKGMDMS